MSLPIPQMVNISNTLPPNTIQQIRADIVDWQNNINNSGQLLSLTDFQKISQYLSALTHTQQKFVSDNALLVDPNNVNVVTEADRNLYNGLLSMYKDYIIQLEQLRVAFNYQQQATQQNLQVQLPQDDSPTVQQQQMQQKIVQPLRQPVISDIPKLQPNERIINHIFKNLPTELAKVRKEFIDKLVKDSELRKSLKPEVDVKPDDDKLLNGIIKLCYLDINNRENIVSYLKLLKLLGYPKELLKEKLPSSLTKPKPKATPKTPQPSTSVSKAIKDLSASSSSATNSSSSSTPVTTKLKQPKKKVGKPEVYIADPNSKKVLNKTKMSAETSSSSSSSSPSLSPTPVTDIPSNEKAEDAANKKKISFSKYLKKEDSELESEGSSTNKRSNSEVEKVGKEDIQVKKQKTSSVSSETSGSAELDLITDDDTSATPGLTSILKSSKNTKKKKSVKIKFVEDNDLVRVYGDDLPTDGLKVTPTDLKRVLRPFVEGEPNEKLYLEAVNASLSGRSTYTLPLNLDNIKNDIKDSDIVETRGGPIRCMTAVPLLYKTEFNNFNKELKKKMPREPIITNDDIETLNNPENKKPIIAKAFGKNQLLLRSDRGGMPYKPVPEVTRNYYPIRYTSK
ncbi:RNA end formation protein 2 [Monosporozyma servazzii]